MLNGQNVLCVFQSNNIDSFLGAWSLWHQYPNATFFSNIADVQPSDLESKEVFVVGPTLPIACIIEMASFCKRLHIFGYETTYGLEIDALNGSVPDNVTLIYKPHQSLATMVWRYLNNNAPVPTIFNYVEDRVQWRYQHPETRPVMTALSAYPPNFERWESLITNPNVQQLVEEGRVLLRGLSRDVERSILDSQRRIDIGGYNVPVINAPPSYASAAGIQLAKGEPFAACYWDTVNGREYDLVSGPDGIDITSLARAYGGHGTAREARFQVPRSHPLAFV